MHAPEGSLASLVRRFHNVHVCGGINAGDYWTPFSPPELLKRKQGSPPESSEREGGDVKHWQRSLPDNPTIIALSDEMHSNTYFSDPCLS